MEKQLWRRSITTQRNDYIQAMHSGSGQLLSVRNTVVSKHMALKDQDYIEVKLLHFESNWKKRLKNKKTIVIIRMMQDLNRNESQ